MKNPTTIREYEIRIQELMEEIEELKSELDSAKRDIKYYEAKADL